MDTVAFERLTNNCIEIVVSAHEAGHSINAVILHTGLRNFEKQVTVSGSEDRQAWTVLAEARPIFDYSRFIDLRHDRVDIVPGRYAFYKLDISNIVESPQSPLVQIVRETQDGALAREVEKTSFTREDFRIESMDFIETLESVLESDRVTRPCNLENLAVTNDSKTRTTIVTFDTPSVPLIELTLTTPSVNFSRKLTVEGCNDKTERHDTGAVPPAWQPIVSSTLTRIDIGKFQQNSTAIGLGGVRRFRHYRLTVHNLDSPPLNIAGVEAKGEVHEALFFRESSAAYRVFYGARDMAPPRYDIAAVLEKTEGPDADVFVAGKQEDNASYKPGRTPAFTGKRLLLPVVMLMVITLVWLIAKTVKRIGPV
jgi:hypothetical protein